MLMSSGTNLTSLGKFVLTSRREEPVLPSLIMNCCASLDNAKSIKSLAAFGCLAFAAIKIGWSLFTTNRSGLVTQSTGAPVDLVYVTEAERKFPRGKTLRLKSEAHPELEVLLAEPFKEAEPLLRPHRS